MIGVEFLLSDADRDLRDQARLFVRDVLPRFPAPAAFPFRAWTRGLREALGEAGFTGLRIPAAFGGAERTALQTALVFEEIARVSPPLAFFLAAHNGFCAVHILRHGSKDQIRRFLPRLASGESPGSWRPPKTAHTPGAASMVEALFDSGTWALRGGPVFDLGVEGEIAVVSAVIPGGDARKARGVFLAEYTGRSGVVRVEILGDRGGAGGKTMETVGATGRVYTAACRLGTASGLLSHILGTERPPADSGLPQNRPDPEGHSAAVEALMELEVVRLRIYRACLLEDAGRARKGEEAILADRAAEESARTANRIAARGAEHGGFFAETAETSNNFPVESGINYRKGA